MYYVPDGTKECGYYECKNVKSIFITADNEYNSLSGLWDGY